MTTDRRSTSRAPRHGAAILTRSLACALLFLVDSSLAAPGVRNVSPSEIDALFADYDSTVTPGCALGVIQGGEFVYRRGYGMANLEHGVPLSAHSVFRIGSTSKQFTAMAVALLAESGSLGIDDSLQAHFPEFPAWAEPVRLRHLIHHTSGIADYLTLAQLAGRGAEAEHFSDEWALKLLARQRKTAFAPGSQYRYSNSGYLLLAHIVKRVSGEDLRRFAARRIFGPLGMRNTHFHDDHTHIVPHRAAGYAPAEDGFRISMTTLDMVGDGGVYTTVDDLLAWDRNFYDNRLGRGSADLVARITAAGALTGGATLDYAFGLRVAEYRGLPMISHGGSYVGYRADLLRFPRQRFSVVVLCNRSDANPSALGRSVADLFLTEFLQSVPETVGPAEAAGLSEAELQRYAGDFWEDEASFLAQTRVIDGRLWAVHSPQRRDRLVPTGPDRFRMLGPAALVLIDFEFEGEDLVRMTRTMDGMPRGVFRPVRLRGLSAPELGEYAGQYYSPELDVDYQLSVAEGRLLFSIDAGDPYPLSPIFGDVFENPDFGTFVFLRAANGRITNLEVRPRRVHGLLFERR